MKNITINEVRTFLAENRKFYAQGCSTGGQPSASDRTAITRIVELVNVVGISESDIDSAISGMFDCYGEEVTVEICAKEAISFAGQSAAADAGYNTDGYSVEITF